MLRNYLTIAFRNLRRRKVLSFIHIAGLSTGLACVMLILLYTQDEASFDRFHEKKYRIFQVTAAMTNATETRKIGNTNKVVGPAFQQEIPEVEGYVRMQTDYVIARRGTETFNQEVLMVDGNFFSVFSLPLLAGNPRTVLSNPNAVVLTEESAETYFGTADAMGKTLELEIAGVFKPFVVTGIAKNPPQNSSIQFGILISLPYDPQSPRDSEWIGFYMNTFVVLHPQADYRAVVPKLDQVFLKNAQAEIAAAKEKFNFSEKIHFGLQPLLQIHLDTEYGDSRNGLTASSKPIYSYVLTSIAVFILLIACINFVNLTIAHSLERGKEIGIRKVVGGQRSQLIGQFLGESFLLCFIAFVLAVLLVHLSMPVFNELANKRLSFSYLLTRQLVAGYAGLFLLTGLIAGFYPALVLSGFNPVQTLYNRRRLTRKNYLTKGLVVLQFALATFLMITTVVIYSQFSYLTTKDLGYDDTHLVNVRLGRGDNAQVVKNMKAALAQEPTIQSVATKEGSQSYTTAQVNGEETEFAISWIDENYLPTLRIPLAAGRNFSENFPADAEQSVIINEAFASAAGWKNPIGQQVDFFYDKKKFTVVGVVKDYHFASLREKIGPLLFKVGSGDLWVKAKPDQAVQALRAIEQTYRTFVPFRPYEYAFMDELNRQQYAEEAKWKQMISLAAGLSIFIACIGLFGLAALSIGQRTKEIGIRKVFGAAVSDMVLLLSKDFVRLVVIAFLVAIPAGYYAASRWMENFAYAIDLRWWLFALPGLLIVLIALLTISLQTWKAARANPVESLRSE